MEWDFVQNESVESLDNVPQEFRGYYAEDKGTNTFKLKDDVKPLAHAYTGVYGKLKNANTQKRNDNQKDAGRRHAIEGIRTVFTDLGIAEEVPDDLAVLPEWVKTQVTSLQESIKGGKTLKVDLDKLRGTFNTQVAAIKTESDQKIAKMTGTLAKYMIDGAANQALVDAGVVEGGSTLLLPHVRSAAKVVQLENGDYAVKVVDAEGAIRINGKGEDMGIADLVAELKQTYPQTFKSAKQSGSGHQQVRETQRTAAQHQQQRQAENMSPQDKIMQGLQDLKR